MTTVIWIRGCIFLVGYSIIRIVIYFAFAVEESAGVVGEFGEEETVSSRQCASSSNSVTSPLISLVMSLCAFIFITLC